MSDTMTVTAVAPNYSNNGYSNPMNFTAPPGAGFQVALFIKRTLEFDNGFETRRRLELILKALQGKKAKMTFFDVLSQAAYAEDKRAKFSPGSYFQNGTGMPNFQPSQQTKLTNGAMAPLAALFHYSFGDGEPLSVDLDKLSFNLTRSNMKPINSILNSGQTGTFNISNQPFGYDFRDSSYWEWSYLGRISLTTNGTLTVKSDGSWNYNGVIRGKKDIYDANADASRGKVGELLTYVLRMIDGKPYDIYLNGEHKVNISGKK